MVAFAMALGIARSCKCQKLPHSRGQMEREARVRRHVYFSGVGPCPSLNETGNKTALRFFPVLVALVFWPGPKAGFFIFFTELEEQMTAKELARLKRKELTRKKQRTEPVAAGNAVQGA